MMNNVQRDGILDWIRDYTGDIELLDENQIALIIDKMIPFIDRQSGISSKGLSRLSISFEAGIPAEVKQLLLPYVKVRFI